MDAIEALRALEPAFVEAGKLALKMQQGVRAYNKFETGNPVADVVTKADLAVQEYLLQAISKTQLTECKLFAEEDTPLTSLFSGESPLYLAIDPIDGTAAYSKGRDNFSTIISLHDGHRMLYTFVYFPAWDWAHVMENSRYSERGKTPNLVYPEDLKKKIAFWSGDPEKMLPKDVLDRLGECGISFTTVKNHSGSFATIESFATNAIAGVYRENTNAYDGLVEMAMAQAKGRKVFSGGPNGRFDLSDIRKRETGFYYPGYYLALNDALSAEI